MADGLPDELGKLAPADGLVSEKRRTQVLAMLARIRIVLILGGVAGATGGAALARGFDLPADDLGGRAAGAFVGLLFGLSLGAIVGLLQASNGRRSSPKDLATTLGSLIWAGRAPDLTDLLKLVFGVARAQSFRRLDTGDYLLLGVAAGAIAGAVLGAELAGTGDFDLRSSWQPAAWTTLGAAAGFGLALAVVYGIWRPWRRLQA